MNLTPTFMKQNQLDLCVCHRFWKKNKTKENKGAEIALMGTQEKKPPEAPSSLVFFPWLDILQQFLSDSD